MNMSVYSVHAWCLWESVDNTHIYIYILKLELQTVGSIYVGAGNKTPVLCKSNKATSILN